MDKAVRRIRQELPQEGIYTLTGVVGTDDESSGHGFKAG